MKTVFNLTDSVPCNFNRSLCPILLSSHMIAYSLSSAPPTNSVFKTQACSCQALLNTHQWLCCFFFKSQIPYPVRSPAQAGLCPPLACHLAALGGPQTRCLPPGGLALPPSPTITWMAVLKPLLTSDSPSSQTTAQHL